MCKVSIIITTRDRADDLRQTLASLAHVRVPPAHEAEVVLVDNGSTDDTQRVAEAFEVSHLPLRYFVEPRPGKARALNTALEHATGEVLLFSDDDLRFPSGWIEAMSAPIRSGEADAVAGSVELAPHLQRARMGLHHATGTTRTVSTDRPGRMVGASMAFSKRVLEKVPGFDPELGPGALGFEEETLFSKQLLEAGYVITFVSSETVTHHLDPARLTRAGRKSAMRRLGRSMGYVGYHWHHVPANPLKIVVVLASCILQLLGKRLAGARNGLSEQEGELWRRFYYQCQLLKECRRPRNYTRHGLVKQRRERARSAFTGSGHST